MGNQIQAGCPSHQRPEFEGVQAVVEEQQLDLLHPRCLVVTWVVVMANVTALVPKQGVWLSLVLLGKPA